MEQKFRALKLEEVANYCHVDLDQVQGWLKKGFLPAFESHGQPRVHMKDLLGFLKLQDIPYSAELLARLSDRVLIIEENLSDATELHKLIRKQNWQVDIALGQFSAGIKITQHLPKVVTLSLTPQALDFIERIHLVHPSCRILALGDDELLLQKAKQLGATTTLLKPTNGQQLIDTLTSLLEDH